MRLSVWRVRLWLCAVAGVTMAVALADTPQCYQYSGQFGAQTYTAGSGSAWCSIVSAVDGYVGVPDNPGPATVGSSVACDLQYPAGVHKAWATANAVPMACPQNMCTSKAGQTVDTVVVDAGPQAIGTRSHDADGCELQIGSAPTNIIGHCAGGMCAVQTASYTGNQVPPDDPSPQTPAGDCFSDGQGGTTCSEGGQGKNCGTFNGDEVCVASIPPGSCVSYASGGVACTMAPGATAGTSPPLPNDGTAGTPATPSGQVQTTSTSGGTSVTTTTNYYTSGVVNGSTSAVPTKPGGQNVGNGGTGSGTSSGGGPNAGNGDCGATGVDCAGDGSIPNLPEEPTVLQSTQTYVSGLSAVPIVAAVGSIAAAIPAGSCPTAQFSVFGHEFTIDAQCALWSDGVAPILQLIMLAVWTLVGVRILMTA